MPLWKLLASSVVVLTVMGCHRTPTDSDETQLSASATASRDSSGKVVTRDATSEELSRLSDVLARVAAVDQKFPQGKAPSAALAVKGKSMTPTGELLLADGRTIVFDGVACTKQGYEYLSRFFLGSDATLLVVENGPAVGGNVPAEVWVVEPMGSGTSTTFPVEGGISTGWCDAKRSDTSPHNDRFAALETAFTAERQAYKASAP